MASADRTPVAPGGVEAGGDGPAGSPGPAGTGRDPARADHALLLGSALALAALGVGTPSAAGTSTDRLAVSATVQAGCALAGGSLDFGGYEPKQNRDLDATGQVRFRSCFGTLTIELGGGQSGTVADRYMRFGSSRLRYQLYRDPGRTVIWGEGDEAVSVQLLSLQDGQIDVFGRIPRGLNVQAGEYTDSVLITMIF